MKIISCNIEGHRHLEERVIPFFKKEKPDVACLQEVFEADMPRLEQVLQMKGEFRVMADVDQVSVHQQVALGSWGVAIFTNLDQPVYESSYYIKKAPKTPVFFQDNDPNSMDRVVLAVTGKYQGQEYTFATTHFTWSTEGHFTEEQSVAYQKMVKILDLLPPHVVCGDFNSPRIWSNEEKTAYQDNVFARLAARYIDTIPKQVRTTIDPDLHKAGALQLTVDGMFSHPKYHVSEVTVVGGISDHQAILAQVGLSK